MFQGDGSEVVFPSIIQECMNVKTELQIDVQPCSGLTVCWYCTIRSCKIKQNKTKK